MEIVSKLNRVVGYLNFKWLLLIFDVILTLTDISCSHERCTEYFMESIQSPVGFYGLACDSYFLYMMNQCRHHKANTLAGAHCNESTHGMYFISTNSHSPFAKGHSNDYYDDDYDEAVTAKASYRSAMPKMEQSVINLQKLCNDLQDEGFKQFLNCEHLIPRVIQTKK